MRTVIDLRAVDRGVHAADGLLAQAIDSGRVREALARLKEVDMVLADMVADENVTTEVAARLGRVRDDLGGYLLAASAMEELVAPEKVAGILRRGATAARLGVAGIGRP